jgi:hypothetical protein
MYVPQKKRADDDMTRNRGQFPENWLEHYIFSLLHFDLTQRRRQMVIKSHNKE